MRMKVLFAFYNQYLVAKMFELSDLYNNKIFECTKVQDLVQICKGQLASVLVPTAIIMEWRKENRCFLSIHKAFNFSMYSDLSLSLSPFSLYISKFPFYIQRHYRKAFNSSHNVLCIWILKEEMETFFAAAFTPPAKEGAQEEKKKKSFFFFTAVLI